MAPLNMYNIHTYIYVLFQNEGVQDVVGSEGVMKTSTVQL